MLILESCKVVIKCTTYSRWPIFSFGLDLPEQKSEVKFNNLLLVANGNMIKTCDIDMLTAITIT